MLLYVCRFGVDSSRIEVQELDVNVSFGGEGVETYALDEADVC